MTASPRAQDARRFCNPQGSPLKEAPAPLSTQKRCGSQIVRRFPARAGTSAANYAGDTPGALQEAFEIVAQKFALKGGKILRGAAAQEAVEAVEVLLDALAGEIRPFARNALRSGRTTHKMLRR